MCDIMASFEGLISSPDVKLWIWNDGMSKEWRRTHQSVDKHYPTFPCPDHLARDGACLGICCIATWHAITVQVVDWMRRLHELGDLGYYKKGWYKWYKYVCKSSAHFLPVTWGFSWTPFGSEDSVLDPCPGSLFAQCFWTSWVRRTLILDSF